jgi:hypothetical protein
LRRLQREHDRDKATGRPIRDDRELISELSDKELAEELAIAAMARDHRRLERFRLLLAENRRRQRLADNNSS